MTDYTKWWERWIRCECCERPFRLWLIDFRTPLCPRCRTPETYEDTVNDAYRYHEAL